MKNSPQRQFGKTGVLHLMLLPTMLILLVYNYLPMVGMTMAFQEFKVEDGWKGLFTSPWVGWANFERVLGSPGSIQSILNTLVISTLKTACLFLFPLIVALLLNEVRKKAVKRTIQTLIYLPYFLSWIIIDGIVKSLFSMDGLVNHLLTNFTGHDPIYFLGEPGSFLMLIIGSAIWKDFGFNTVVFLAALTAIDPQLYEAAEIDGASRWLQTKVITIPGIKDISILLLVLSVGGILNAGFDQIYNLYSVPVYPTGDIIDTFVYRIGLQSAQYEIGVAVGLFKSVVSFGLVAFSYWAAKRFANYRIF